MNNIKSILLSISLLTAICAPNLFAADHDKISAKGRWSFGNIDSGTTLFIFGALATPFAPWAAAISLAVGSYYFGNSSSPEEKIAPEEKPPVKAEINSIGNSADAGTFTDYVSVIVSNTESGSGDPGAANSVVNVRDTVSDNSGALQNDDGDLQSATHKKRDVLKEFKYELLKKVLPNIELANIDELAMKYEIKKTLDGASVNYDQLNRNKEDYISGLRARQTENTEKLAQELNNVYRHIESGSLVNARHVVYLLLTTTEMKSEEQDYIFSNQEEMALALVLQRLALVLQRLALKFKELETGRGVQASGKSVFQINTLEQECQLLRHFISCNEKLEADEEQIILAAEKSKQSTRVDRKDRLKEVFKAAVDFNEVITGIEKLLSEQEAKDQECEILETCVADQVPFRNF